MTETLRFSQIGKQDLKIGTGQFEVRLGDGRIVTLDEIKLTDFLSSLTVGSVLFVKTGGVAGENNSNVFWDNVNLRLGIGTASPSHPLHVVGIILGTQNLVFRSGTAFDGTLDHAITADRTWTLQDSSDTLLARATTDTLTNKTLLATGSGNVVTGIIDRDVITADVVSTLAETTVYSFSVPGGTLGTGNALRLTVIGDYLNNSGANRNFSVRAKYGGTTFAFGLSSGVTVSVSRRGFMLRTTLSANNATNAQVSVGEYVLGLAASVSGTLDTKTTDTWGVHNAIAIDSTSAQTLLVTLEHSASDANLSGRALAVQLEVLR